MTQPDRIDAKWYALLVHSRQEKKAAFELERLGFEVFLPTLSERRIWSDRVRDVQTPLFPGYLFVRLALRSSSRLSLLKVKQVSDLVGRLPGDDRIARPVHDEEILSLQTVLSSERFVDPVSRMEKGTKIRAFAGPLKGVLGTVDTVADGKRRLSVHIELLGRGVRTVLHGDDLVEQKP
ncbi:transcription termination/antitermination NusG family protein [Myxococcota bacterium]|nr:transcription termination/antitermination NusG family protein [Myxococcota bacterium]